MATEKLNAFIKLYEQQADADVNKYSERIAKYTELLPEWEEARTNFIELAKGEGIDEKVAEGMYSINGILNSNYLKIYSQSVLSDELKVAYRLASTKRKIPRKLASADRHLNNSHLRKASGGEKFIDKLKAFIKGNPEYENLNAENWDNLEMNEDAEGFPSSPSKIISSPELKSIILDDSTTEEKESSEKQEPINDIDETAEVNEEGEESSAINDIGDETIKPDESGELGEKVEPKEESISSLNVESSDNLNIPEETATEEVESSDLNIPPKEDKTAVEEKPKPGEWDPLFGEPPPTSDTINNNITNVAAADENVTVDAAQSPVNTDEPKKKKGKFGKFLNKLGGGISNMYQSSSLGETISSISKDFKSSAIGSSINSIVNTKKESNEYNTESPSINSTSNVSGDIINSTGASTEENTVNSPISTISNLEKDKETIQNTKDKTLESITNKESNLSSVSKSSIVPPPPVTKEDISSVGKDISSSVAANTGTSNLNVPSVESPSKKEMRIENRENRKENRQAKREEKKGGVNVNSDSSEVERRLKNIELLLMGPLEVKIKN